MSIKKYYLKERVSIVSTSDGIKPTTDAFYGPWDSLDAFKTWFSSISTLDNVPSGAKIGVSQPDGTVEEYRIQNAIFDKKVYFERILTGNVSSDDIIMSNSDNCTLTDAFDELAPGIISITGAVYFNTVADLKASTVLRAGDVAITKGFYTKDDGGGAVYNIISTPSSIGTYPANDFNLFELANGLYADIAITGGEVSFLQIGGRPHSKYAYPNQPRMTFANNNNPLDTLLTLDGKTVYDNKEALEAYVVLCKRKNEGIVLNIPTGHYFTSPAFLGATNRGVIINGVHEQGDEQNMTSFHAIKRMQDYIWSVSGQRVLNNKNYTQYGPSNIRITNICFDGGVGGQDTYKFKIMPKVALVCVGANMSYFDGIFLRSLMGGIVIGNTQETHFGLINVRGVGGFYRGEILNPIRFICTGGYSANRFAVKVWGVSQEDYTPFVTNRNCSALYFDYFNCEGVFGSVIHAELGSNFTHSEINNVQWEATMKNIPGPSDEYYPGLMNFRYEEPTLPFYKWRIGETAALSNTPASYNYSNEKIIRCGFVSGDLYDIVIHCVTVTWGTDGQIWGYNGTLYRVAQSAIVCIGSTTNDQNDSESGKYTNVNLITYNIRESHSFRALYMGISSSGVYSSTYPFSCCKPVVRTTKEFVVKSGCPMPRITFVDLPVSNRIYCAMAGPANNDAGCLYESSSVSPAHIVRNGGAFSFIYDSSKHYRCYGRFTQTSGVIKVYNGDTVYGNLNSKYSDGSYHIQDLDLESLNIPNGTRVFITATKGAWAFEYVDFYDNALVYGEPSLKWSGRKWIDDQGVIHTCT